MIEKKNRHVKKMRGCRGRTVTVKCRNWLFGRTISVDDKSDSRRAPHNNEVRALCVAGTRSCRQLPGLKCVFPKICGAPSDSPQIFGKRGQDNDLHSSPVMSSLIQISVFSELVAEETAKFWRMLGRKRNLFFGVAFFAEFFPRFFPFVADDGVILLVNVVKGDPGGFFLSRDQEKSTENGNHNSNKNQITFLQGHDFINPSFQLLRSSG
ncbi:hypothetical protein [Geothermobacter hydrogeniphilus]|uniref:hypothetical protein n=1 Tax=Geothermobacter hydrogeniphilus TaxID=1969733 RepID=UPI0015561A50|nr:hypothetical protein [Geothermobacter hydrogeniphilus]